MNDNGNSFAEFPVDFIIDKCEQKIKEIKLKREEADKKKREKLIDEDFIRKIRIYKVKLFFSFGFIPVKMPKKIDEEEADKILSDDRWEWSYPCINYSEQLSNVKRIMRMSKMAQINGKQTVFIGAKDSGDIFI